jgi:hypothetical protein
LVTTTKKKPRRSTHRERERRLLHSCHRQL